MMIRSIVKIVAPFRLMAATRLSRLRVAGNSLLCVSQTCAANTSSFTLASLYSNPGFLFVFRLAALDKYPKAARQNREQKACVQGCCIPLPSTLLCSPRRLPHSQALSSKNRGRRAFEERAGDEATKEVRPPTLFLHLGSFLKKNGAA